MSAGRVARWLLAAAVVVGGGAAAVVAASGDRVPRGVHVAGVDLSGFSADRAQRVLARELADDAARPLRLRAGEVALTLPPLRSGLRVDVAATVAEARTGGPLDRLRGLLGTRRDVRPVAEADPVVLRAALRTLARQVDRPAREGTVSFTGTVPRAVDPQPGRTLQVDRAVEAVLAAYPAGDRVVELPVAEDPVRSTSETVRRAVEEVARPAVAAGVTVRVGDRSLLVRPVDLATGLDFTVDDEGALRPSVDGQRVLESLGGRLDRVAVEPRDARYVQRGGTLEVVPSKDGQTLPAAGLARALEGVLTAPAPRSVAVALVPAAPRVSTAQATGIGIDEVIGTFTTRHPCCRPRVTNIHRIADLVDGYVVLPGETFSLNGAVGRRDRARGFVEAPQILRGQFVDDVGGGVSQFATTMFNAVFFSGLQDVQHKPHSYYISRYPPGREATVSFPQPDLRWRNDSPNGVAVLTSYTGTSVTVTFWGTKRYDITSETGPRTRIRPFGKQYVDRPDCTPSAGEEGFDIVVTRVFRMAGKVVRRQPFRTRYLPEPNFICGRAPRGGTAGSSPSPAPSSSSSGAGSTGGPRGSGSPSPRPSG